MYGIPAIVVLVEPIILRIPKLERIGNPIMQGVCQKMIGHILEIGKHCKDFIRQCDMFNYDCSDFITSASVYNSILVYYVFILNLGTVENPIRKFKPYV